jgi:hypothetical protein
MNDYYSNKTCTTSKAMPLKREEPLKNRNAMRNARIGRNRGRAQHQNTKTGGDARE